VRHVCPTFTKTEMAYDNFLQTSVSNIINTCSTIHQQHCDNLKSHGGQFVLCI